LCFLIPAPSDGQIRGDGERGGHAGDCHPAAEHLLHHRIAADAPRHHHGHAGGGHYLPGKLQEIGFPRQGTAITGLAVHGGRLVAAAGELHQIHPEGVEHRYHRPGIVGAEAAALKVGGVELDRQREAAGHLLADPLHYLQQQSGAVFQAPAKAIAAQIGQRREKLAQQIAVGGVDLHPVKAKALRQQRRIDELLLHLGNVGLAHGLGRGELAGEAAERHGHLGRGQGGLPQRRRHLAAGVIDLHPDLGAPAFGRLGPGMARPSTITLPVMNSPAPPWAQVR